MCGLVVSVADSDSKVVGSSPAGMYGMSLAGH